MTTNTTSADQVERRPCPKCEASAVSPSRTDESKVAASYHTGRFALVPALKAELTGKTPTDRSPGRQWVTGAPVPQVTQPIPGAAIRLGYARCSTASQELQSQLDAPARADCTRAFSEKISSRVSDRPELEKALTLAREIRQASPGRPAGQ